MSTINFYPVFLLLSSIFVIKTFAEEVTFTSDEGGEAAGTCTIYPGYDIEPGYDLELRYGLDFSECCKLCSETSGCKGWTHFEGKCHLKRERILVNAFQGTLVTSGINHVNGAEPEDVEVIDSSSYLVHSPKDSAGNSASCSLHKGIISDESNIRVVDRYLVLSECCHECSITEGCVAWTHYLGQCSLKSSTKVKRGSRGISGILVPALSGDVAPSPA